jgi:hypothetical protein
MALAPFLLYAFSLVLLSLAYDDQQDVFDLLATMHNSTDPLNTCDRIAMTISGASEVFFPSERPILFFVMPQSDECQDTSEYLSDISHAASSSTQPSACSVEPGSAEDVSKIVSYLDFMHHLRPSTFSVASSSGIKPNTFRGERWRTYTEPGIFLDERRGDRDDTLQRDQGQFRGWNS